MGLVIVRHGVGIGVARDRARDMAGQGQAHFVTDHLRIDGMAGADCDQSFDLRIDMGRVCVAGGGRSGVHRRHTLLRDRRQGAAWSRLVAFVRPGW